MWDLIGQPKNSSTKLAEPTLPAFTFGAPVQPLDAKVMNSPVLNTENVAVRDPPAPGSAEASPQPHGRSNSRMAVIVLGVLQTLKNLRVFQILHVPNRCMIVVRTPM